MGGEVPLAMCTGNKKGHHLLAGQPRTLSLERFVDSREDGELPDTGEPVAEDGEDVGKKQ